MTRYLLWLDHLTLITPGGSLSLHEKYALLTKHEVKMAGYWPSSFLLFYGPRRSRSL